MKAILEKMQKMQTETGMRVSSNLFDFGSCNVIKDGKSVFRGDAITCHAYIMKAYNQLTISKNNTDEK